MASVSYLGTGGLVHPVLRYWSPLNKMKEYVLEVFQTSIHKLFSVGAKQHASSPLLHTFSPSALAGQYNWPDWHTLHGALILKAGRVRASGISVSVIRSTQML